MNALDLRNHITEHVGKYGRRASMFIEIPKGERIETYEIESVRSTEVLDPPAGVVLTLGKMVKSKIRY